MRRMITALSLVLGLAASAGTSEALPLSIGDAFYLGSVVRGAPASPAREALYIDFLGTLAPGAALAPGPYRQRYSREGSTASGPLLDATAVGSTRATSATVDATGFTYVLAKYGGGSRVWYIGGSLGTITVPARFGGTTGRRLSHVTLFNPGTSITAAVPDGGTTLMLLGGALAGLGVLRRRFGT